MANKVLSALAGVMAEIEAIPKSQQNAHFKYKFRGVDQLMVALHPLMAKHGLVLRQKEVRGKKEGKLTTLKVSYAFVSTEDGSEFEFVGWGQGEDNADKGANKALQAAFKYALFQVFCIPTEEVQKSDADAHGPVADEIPEAWNNAPKELNAYESEMKGEQAAFFEEAPARIESAVHFDQLREVLNDYADIHGGKYPRMDRALGPKLRDAYKRIRAATGAKDDSDLVAILAGNVTER